MARGLASFAVLALLAGSSAPACLEFSPEYPEPPLAAGDASVDADAGDGAGTDFPDAAAMDAVADSSDGGD
jgi:hypothetical protein